CSDHHPPLHSFPTRRSSDLHFLRAQIIGMVITGAQNISAKNNAPFHFRPETFLTCAAVKAENVFRIFSTIPVTHAIEASEVRRRDRKSTRLNSSHDQISYAV